MTSTSYNHQCHQNQGKSEKLTTKRGLRKQDDKPQYGILHGILNRKRTLETKEIWIKHEVNKLTLVH